MSISKSQIESILNQTRETKKLVEQAPETAKQAAALEYCDSTIALWEVALEGIAAAADKKDDKKSTLVPVKKKAAPKKQEEPKEEPLIEDTATDETGDDEDWLD